jgi:hypothetical protein
MEILFIYLSLKNLTINNLLLCPWDRGIGFQVLWSAAIHCRRWLQQSDDSVPVQAATQWAALTGGAGV